MSVRAIILEQIQSIASQQRKKLVPLHDNLALLNTGLDSLCIAILVSSLDDKFNVDPFENNSKSMFPVTLGDFITLYESAVNESASVKD